MQAYWFLLGALCTWRITHLLQAEDGPWDLVVRLRRAAGSGFWAHLLDCFNCLSLWVALPLAFSLGESWVERALMWPALSGAAMLLERITPRAHSPTLVEEDDDGVLWTEEDGPAPDTPKANA